MSEYIYKIFSRTLYYHSCLLWAQIWLVPQPTSFRNSLLCSGFDPGFHTELAPHSLLMLPLHFYLTLCTMCTGHLSCLTFLWSSFFFTFAILGLFSFSPSEWTTFFFTLQQPSQATRASYTCALYSLWESRSTLRIRWMSHVFWPILPLLHM